MVFATVDIYRSVIFLSRAPPLKLSRLCSLPSELIAYTDYNHACIGIKLFAGDFSIRGHKPAIGSGRISKSYSASKIDYG